MAIDNEDARLACVNGGSAMLEDNNAVTRRRFLAQLTMAGAGAMALQLTGCNMAAHADASMSAVGKVGDFTEGQYKKVTLPDGSGAYVTKTGDSFRALASKCTHKGCEVLWVPGRKVFQCPCHGGQFNAEGKNIAGPPPTPLPTLATKIDGDTVYVASA
jgi:Rieske Fe-S protein